MRSGRRTKKNASKAAQKAKEAAAKAEKPTAAVAAAPPEKKQTTEAKEVVAKAGNGRKQEHPWQWRGSDTSNGRKKWHWYNHWSQHWKTKEWSYQWRKVELADSSSKFLGHVTLGGRFREMNVRAVSPVTRP